MNNHELAFENEQHTVDFYLDIADEVKDPFIKERFRNAAANEQNHDGYGFFLLYKTYEVSMTNRRNTYVFRFIFILFFNPRNSTRNLFRMNDKTSSHSTRLVKGHASQPVEMY